MGATLLLALEAVIDAVFVAAVAWFLYRTFTGWDEPIDLDDWSPL